MFENIFKFFLLYIFMDNLITKAKIEKYYVITLKALEIAKQSVSIENFEKIGVTKFSKKD